MASSPLKSLKALGQSVWLDNLPRRLLIDGSLQRLIAEDGLSGITSNPSIFQKAISESEHYQEDILRLRNAAPDSESRYEALVVPDVQAACDLFRPVFDASHGDDGYVSLELNPQLAHDLESTLNAAERLRRDVGRDNLLLKVPATPTGIQAFEELTARGFKINVTLMFSLRHVRDVFAAYVRGMRRWVGAQCDPREVKAVASLFLSRVDTLVDQQLSAIGSAEALALRGRTAVAMAKLAYQHFLHVFHGPDFADLLIAGARPQYLLWASTGIKNPDYSDLLYVEPLIGPQTINTMPDATLAAFRDHGHAAPTLTEGVAEAEQTLARLAALGIDLDGAVAEQLQQEGMRLFEASFAKLLELVS